MMPSDRPVNMLTSKPMSPAQAAQYAEVSRRTIMRAIENLELQANRDNRNHWKIDFQDLDKWASAQCAPSEHAHEDTPTLPTSMPNREAVDLAIVRAENEQLRERLTDVEQDRDAWRIQAERLSKALPSPDDPPQRPRRWRWPWQ